MDPLIPGTVQSQITFGHSSNAACIYYIHTLYNVHVGTCTRGVLLCNNYVGM